MKKFCIVKLNKNLRANLLQCYDKVINSLDNPDFFIASNSKEIVDALNSCDFSIGVVLNNEIIAFSLIKYDPVYNSYNFEDTAVLKKYRGNNLQLIMWQYQINFFFIDTSVTCTIHPLNFSSLKNSLLLGMSVIGYRECYNGLPRYICHYSPNEITNTVEFIAIIPVINYQEIKRFLLTGHRAKLYLEGTTEFSVYIYKE